MRSVFNLLRRNRQVEPTHAAVPRGTRVYAIGDIHGRCDLLYRMTELVLHDAAAGPPAHNYIVYLGDYVDRGPDSRDVIEFLAAGPPPGFGAVHLRGNHEVTLLNFLTDISVGTGWFSYGGLATLESYGIVLPQVLPPETRLALAQHELRRRLPPRHHAFLRDLRASVVIGDYFFAHAGVKPGVPLTRQDEGDLIWIRESFLESNADHGKVVVHGHTISDEPELRVNRIGIDTGAFATGRLTCLVLHENTRRFLTT